MKKTLLNRLPKELQRLIEEARGVAEQCNVRLFLVGGFVRDILLGVKNLDLDLVVEGDGIAFSERLAARLKAGLTRHRRFATATIFLDNGLKIDIATARKESYPEPASLPLVVSGTLSEDLLRRDFSINAMAVSLNEDPGRLIDLFGGGKDLRKKKIRVLHPLSFIDDPTRILRAVRFEQRLGFSLEGGTHALLTEAVKKGMLERVQPQRLRDELVLILKEEEPIRQVQRLYELTGLRFIHARLRLTAKTFALMRSVRRQAHWFKESYPGRRQLDCWLMYLMALLDGLTAGQTQEVVDAFVFRKGEEKRLLSYKKTGPGFIKRLSRKDISPSEVFGMLEPLSYEAILLLKAKSRNRLLQARIHRFLQVYNGMRVSISGADLKALGVAPGPRYQAILSRVLKAKLNGLVKDREDELALARRAAKSR